MSNEGDGFLRFQARIDAIAEAIGEPTLRQAIAEHFSACLELEMRRARGLSSYGGLPWGVAWTMATTAEFNLATDRGNDTLTLHGGPLSLPAVAEAPWRGTVLRLRGTRVCAEGGGYKLPAASCFIGSPQYDRKLRRDVSKWQISMDKQFLDSMAGRYYSGGSRPQSTHANSEAGAHKALRRMIKDFLGAELVAL